MGQNYLLWSEDFTNAVWTQKDTVNGNVVAAPNGAVTADHLIETTDGQNFTLQDTTDTIVVGEKYTFSVYLRLTGTGDGDGQAILSLGRSGAGTFEESTKTVTLTAAWQRFQVSHTYANNQTGFRAILTRSAGHATEIYLWGAQINNGTAAGGYLVTTTAARTVDDGRTGPMARVGVMVGI